MLNNYPNYIQIYTDGSLLQERTGCAIIFQNTPYIFRLPNNTSIFTAELYAILRALNIIAVSPHQNFLICSDSLSALQAIKSGSLNSIISSIYDKFSQIPNNKTIVLEWNPSHKSIPGNEFADKMAKNSLNFNHITNIPPEYLETKCRIRKLIHKFHQEYWDQLGLGPERTPLHDIKPIIKKWESSNRRSRQEEVVIARLRLGSCLFDIKHHLTGDPRPRCPRCGVFIDLSHILMHCPLYSNQRSQIQTLLRKENLPLNLNSILNDNFPQDLIIKFLKDIDQFDNI